MLYWYYYKDDVIFFIFLNSFYLLENPIWSYKNGLDILHDHCLSMYYKLEIEHGLYKLQKKIIKAVKKNCEINGTPTKRYIDST